MPLHCPGKICPIKVTCRRYYCCKPMNCACGIMKDPPYNAKRRECLMFMPWRDKQARGKGNPTQCTYQ
ncbi:hypothetical protein LCGC14_0359360 [marine sediment metagenome]|uniref:Uncharacterized protein n=1 Tax=marine sediment metagenome TaxID=412755 RepID=A0A0F9VVP9_9ZZZZ